MAASGQLDEATIQDGIKKRRRKLSRVLSLYNPANYCQETVSLNRSAWTGEAKAVYDDYVDFVDTQFGLENINEVDEDTLNNLINAATADYAKFLDEIGAKCVSSSRQGGAGADKARMADIEVKLDAEAISDGVTSLDKAIKKFKDWSLCENHEIEVGMGQVSDWRQDVKTLKAKLYNVRRNTEVYGLDNSMLASSEEAINKIEASMELAIEAIEHEDTTRCLYSLNHGKESSVKYPTFSGGIDENYLRFEKEMKAAFIANRVALDDQVKILRDNLKPPAKTLVPETIESITRAFRILGETYNDPGRVMKSRKLKLEEMGPLSNSEAKTVSNIRSQVEWLIQFETHLLDIFAISVESDDMDREAFNLTFFRSVLSLLPWDITKEISNVSGSVQEKMEALLIKVTELRLELQDVMLDLPDKDTGKEDMATMFMVNGDTEDDSDTEEESYDGG